MYFPGRKSLLLKKLNSTNHVLIPTMFPIRALTVEWFPAVSSCRILPSSFSLSLACLCLLSRSCVPTVGDRELESAMTLESVVLSPDTFRCFGTKN